MTQKPSDTVHASARRKAKMFGLPCGAGAPLGEIVNDGQAEAGSFVTEILPLERIEPDPDNPRRLGLDYRNPRNIAEDDPERDRKQAALAGLEELKASIVEHGVQQPIKVYPFGRGYRIIFGERRYLAARMAGRRDIPAWILSERPRFLRTVQFTENEHHDRLPAWERLENVRQIVIEYESYGEERISTAQGLSELTGLGLTMANNYYDLLRGSAEVREAVEHRVLTNIQLAAEIAREDDAQRRQAALEAVRQGATAREVRTRLRAVELPQPRLKPRTSRGRPAGKVSFGGTRNTRVVQRIMESVLGNELEQVLEGPIDWDDYNSVTEAWKRLLAHLEAQEQPD